MEEEGQEFKVGYGKYDICDGHCSGDYYGLMVTITMV